MKESKKIIYFLDFVNCLGGSNKVLLTQAYIMKQRGYQVKMVIPVQDWRQPIEECNEVCRRYGLEILRASYSISICLENIDILKALRDCKDIVKLLKEDKPDLIHSSQLNIAVELAARDLRIPHLMNIYLQLPEILHLAEVLLYFRAQLICVYDLPGSFTGVRCHKHKKFTCFLIMYDAGVDWDVLLRPVAFP